MLSVSQDFAPPFKLISPFFILGSLFYLTAAVYLFFFSVEEISLLDTKVLSLTHLFLLGFIMMTIFGAMAQLVPVVLEVGHFGVELFYAIWPLLGIGTVLMVLGFLNFPGLLPYGGVVVLISMMIFVMEIFLTIKKVEKFNLVVYSILISNIFLFFGIIFGLVMALTYAGTIQTDINALLKAHVFLVVGGYITITLMGLSVVLLPMFGLSHGFSKKPLELSIGFMSVAVLAVVLSSLIDLPVLKYIGYILSITSLFVYFYMVLSIYKTRARKEIDIYVKSLIFSYFSMISAVIFAISYLVFDYEPFILSSGWLMFFGFFAFAITGHVYKIIPFLVWFERFSPLVGKQKVPMLAEMLPKKSSSAQFLFSAIGVVVIAIAVSLKDAMFIKAGASFLLIGVLAFVRSVFFMINYK